MLFRLFFLVFSSLLHLASAKRTLSANSLVTCMDNSQISPSYFNVTFNPDDRSLRYSLDLTTELSGYVTAHVQVFAYGFSIIERDIDLCSLGWKQFCPIYPGSMQVESIEYISEKYVNLIPGIAYNVPDIDAVVKVEVRDRDSGVIVSCIQSSFTNGKTVSQTGAKWATAIIAGLGLLIGAILSTFGNSNAASHISANAVSLFLYFQSVVVVSMQHVERVPPIASAWAENLAWSMGLIRVTFMQEIFRWYVQSTGGTPTLYFKGVTKQILVQRAYKYLNNLHSFVVRNDESDLIPSTVKRSIDFNLQSNQNLIVLRGIKRIGYGSHIEPTSIVVTGFTFFLLCGFLLVVLLVLIKQLVQILIHFKKMNPNRLSYFRKSFSSILKGALLRYIYIGFTQLVILSLWEFTVQDSPAVIVLAVLFLILSIGTLGLSFWKSFYFGKLSIQQYKNPAALLYGDSMVLNKYGFCYTMFNATKYWFGVVLIGYAFIKAIFIALCQPSGKTSTLVIFILDLAYTIYLFIQAPYLDKSTNIVNYCMSIVNTINSFLFLFFSDLFGQPAPVASIMGWVFFVLNAAFSLILLLMIVVLMIIAVTTKNPDARFAPAKDDRASFQRKSSIKYKNGFNSNEKNSAGNELAALGIAAQDHSTDWETEMYRLNELNNGSKSDSNVRSSPLSEKNIFSPSANHTEDSIEEESDSLGDEKSNKQYEEPKGLGAKLKNLTRGLSLKKKDAGNEGHTNVSRISDTLIGNSNDDEIQSNALTDADHASPTPNHFRDRSVFSFTSNNNPTNTKDFV